MNTYIATGTFAGPKNNIKCSIEFQAQSEAIAERMAQTAGVWGDHKVDNGLKGCPLIGEATVKLKI